jgi:Co/Zn/Cd efflux system component
MNANLRRAVLTHSGSLTKAAFLSARNDTLANIAIIVAMNADAAREVWSAVREEHRVANA